MTQACFLISTLSEFPNLKDPRGIVLPEIALAGKSNVGKSSLINHWTQQNGLAKTSATPGKTQLLNFFLIQEKFILVDLPGYGFAKAPLEKIEIWSSAVDRYLNEREPLRLILLLVDSRRPFSEEDESLIDWAEKKSLPLLLIFTKTDKLSVAQKEALLKNYPDALLYSIFESQPSRILQKKIDEMLWA